MQKSSIVLLWTLGLIACAESEPNPSRAAAMPNSESKTDAAAAGQNALEPLAGNGGSASVPARPDAGPDGSARPEPADAGALTRDDAGTCQPYELCDDGLDGDCDGEVDEDCNCAVGMTQLCYEGPAEFAGVGACAVGTQRCLESEASEFGQWGKCSGSHPPGDEICGNLVDDDCNGSVDDGCGCPLGTTRECYSGPEGTRDVGLCAGGRQSCLVDEDGAGVWSRCEGEVLPAADVCDGVDRACTGAPGQGCPCILGETRSCYGGPAGTADVGRCSAGTQHCEATDDGAQWSAVCADAALPDTQERCGNELDDDCNGETDEGCNGSLICPAHLSASAGTPVSLSVTASQIDALHWRVIAAPDGADQTVQWNPSSAQGTDQILTTFIVGTYTVEVSGQDPRGSLLSCTFDLTALPHGLRVELSWDGDGDVDLHLHNAQTTPWFSDPDDCHYSNRTPAWGAALDIDNVTGLGPENARVDAPEVGMPYTIGVHNFARAEGRIATVNIYCGDAQGVAPVATFVSRSLAGTDTGRCTENDFWGVARVTFTSATACTIEPIDIYATSLEACGG